MKLYPQNQDHGGPVPEGQGPTPETTNSQDKVDPQKTYAKKRVKYHVKSLREIGRAQKIVGLLIPRLPFMRVVKEIPPNICSMMKTASFVNVEWQTQGLLCLQEAKEDFVVDFMNDVYLCAAHCHRVTLMAKDYVVVSRLR
ncbi:hypothetical protein KP509_21G068100 [Ceratopteris richardii]|uniref:Core Histone H2A/H2B/H3 domain-containing protein n=1 Tax=Ceratopteris richardii TaxID=49495 RepID=A0A8T2SCG5_CERRI|nr:hypothetical protein KP509_21G068100 [Ceratopteris richardii]